MPDKHAAHTTAPGIPCRLCGDTARFEFQSRVLVQHDAAYYQCRSCGLLQTEVPYWLDEAYASAMAAVDTGVMLRNIQLMKVVSVLLKSLNMQGGVFLDYGGGHGVFTRLMRDRGFDFHCWDPYAENIFARGFEGAPDQPYKGVTAFEVLEHLQEPRLFFDRILGGMQPDIFLASTETFSDPVDRDWHYFYFPTGQHIAFYQKRTLIALAVEHGYMYLGLSGLHLFARVQVHAFILRFMLRFGSRLYPLFRFPSLVMPDHQRLMNGMR